MDDFQRKEDCVPNMNAATIAGKVIRVEALSGKTPGLAITLGYMKSWPNGSRQEIPIRIYTTGAERVEKLSWVKVGEVVLAQGEVTDRGAVYAHHLEWLSKPPRHPGEGDQFLEGMQAVEVSQS